MFECSFEAAKRSFYRTANSIFGKIGRCTSEETTLQLIQSKCIPALLYGLEACPTNKSDIRSLDFVLDRFFMKLFRTSNVAMVRQCQELFGFQLPSITLCKRVDKFVGKYYASDNLLCKICSKFCISCVLIDIYCWCHNLCYFTVYLYCFFKFIIVSTILWWIKIFSMTDSAGSNSSTERSIDRDETLTSFYSAITTDTWRE